MLEELSIHMELFAMEQGDDSDAQPAMTEDELLNINVLAYTEEKNIITKRKLIVGNSSEVQKKKRTRNRVG